MLKILIVEDDAKLASTLKYLVEDNPRYRVVGIAEDLPGTLAALGREEPDLALVDLHLARGSTGFSVAVRLNDMGIPVLFASGKAPAFAMPDLALGCLMKPFTGDEVHRALAMAEDMMRGRETLRPRVLANLQLYGACPVQHPQEGTEQQVYVPAHRRSLTQRLGQWIA